MLHIFVRWTTNSLGFYDVVPCAEKMCHLLSAACQYASYFVRWTTNSLGFYDVVPCAEKMSSFVSSLHILSGGLPILLVSLM